MRRLLDVLRLGRPDILITAKGGARAWLNEGPGGSIGAFRDIGRTAADSGLPPQDIQFADMDGDGKADVSRIAWTGVIHPWLNNLPADYFQSFIRNDRSCATPGELTGSGSVPASGPHSRG